MEIRPYQPADRGACEGLCGPFAVPDHFFVMEHEDEIIGCGGYSNAGRLLLGVVRQDLRGQGLGRYLLLYRLRGLSQLPGVTHARLTAPDEFAGFYLKQGFKPAGRLGELQLRLQVCP